MSTPFPYEPANHSHRPWHLVPMSGEHAHVCDSNGNLIAKVNVPEAFGPGNGALIAAAPDLLAAVKALETLYLDVLPVLTAHASESQGGQEDRLPVAIHLATQALQRLSSARSAVAALSGTG